MSRKKHIQEILRRQLELDQAASDVKVAEDLAADIERDLELAEGSARGPMGLLLFGMGMLGGDERAMRAGTLALSREAARFTQREVARASDDLKPAEDDAAPAGPSPPGNEE